MQKSHLNLVTIKVILETSTFVYTCYSFSTLAEQNFSYFLPKRDKKIIFFYKIFCLCDKIDRRCFRAEMVETTFSFPKFPFPFLLFSFLFFVPKRFQKRKYPLFKKVVSFRVPKNIKVISFRFRVYPKIS